MRCVEIRQTGTGHYLADRNRDSFFQRFHFLFQLFHPFDKRVESPRSPDTAEMKQQAVEEYLRGEGTLESISRKYHIFGNDTLRQWIQVYNSNRELRGYNPRPEVYVAMRKKTTKEEREEIVRYCLEHGKDYKGTAAKYEVSYSQVYQWVRHYEENGEAGLEDRRGKRKSNEEVDELERLRRENLRLKAKLQESERLNLLLKKVKEFERS